MKDITIDLTNDSHGGYLSEYLFYERVNLCAKVLHELFDITKENITLLISDKKTRGSYKVQFDGAGLDLVFLDITSEDKDNEYILNRTRHYIYDNHPELFTKSFYISILQ